MWRQTRGCVVLGSGPGAAAAAAAVMGLPLLGAAECAVRDSRPGSGTWGSGWWPPGIRAGYSVLLHSADLEGIEVKAQRSDAYSQAFLLGGGKWYQPWDNRIRSDKGILGFKRVA